MMDAISTGSVSLDHLIRGHSSYTGKPQCPGIPRGRITEIYGEENTGKTTVALSTAAKCQESGGSVCYLDFNCALDPSYVQKLGVETAGDNWHYFMPTTWEQGAEIIKVMVKKGVDLIVVDSVPSMMTEKGLNTRLLGGDFQEQVKELARLQSEFLPFLTEELYQSNTAVVYLNELRDWLDQGAMVTCTKYH